MYVILKAYISVRNNIPFPSQMMWKYISITILLSLMYVHLSQVVISSQQNSLCTPTLKSYDSALLKEIISGIDSNYFSLAVDCVEYEIEVRF